MLDENGRTAASNAAFARMLGRPHEAPAGRDIGDLLGTDFPTACADGETGKRTFNATINGRTYSVIAQPAVISGRRWTIVVWKDSTEIDLLRERLRNVHLPATVGILVPGIIHDINNPLTGTISYVELLRMTSNDADIRAELDKIAASTERCRKIIGTLQEFARSRPASKSMASIGGIIDGAVDLLAYRLRSGGIEVVRRYEEDASALVDVHLLQQAVLALLLNAQQAILAAGRKDGRIIIAANRAQDRRSVTITVQDNGPGIDSQSLPQIFDPFSPAAQPGDGSGWGLALAREFVAAHNGSVTAANAANGGTLFTIVLPTAASFGGAAAPGHSPGGH